jgi:hypothetical protein
LLYYLLFKILVKTLVKVMWVSLFVQRVRELRQKPRSESMPSSGSSQS